jgi:lipopolysaccharide transport system permease protein
MRVQTFETVVEPDRGWFDWRLRQLWRYRELVGMFVWRDFIATYKQTILGPTWHVIQPLFTTVVFTLVFSRVANLSTDGVPAFLFYMSGTLLWAYFANCVTGTSRMFVANVGVLGKVYFHRLVIPVSIVVSNLIAFGIQLALFAVTMLVYAVSGHGPQLTAWAVLFPLLVLLLAGHGFAIGLIVAALTTRYRDLTYAVTLGVQMLMYLTPIIYPTSAIPYSLRFVAALNPLAPIVEAFRLGFLGAGTVTAGDLFGSALWMLVSLVLALMLFTKAERTFLDTV